MKLEVSHISKHYGKTAALDDLSLAVDAIRVLVLIGPSGGGKSTLLRVLGGLEPPDTGSVHLNGAPIPADPRSLRAFRAANGFLFQQFNLFPHLDVLRNITLPLVEVHGMSPASAKTRALASLERFGLADQAPKLPAQLSGGQQQRVGLARAVAHRPSILFLDEPTSALDPEMSAEVLELIQELAEAGQDIILTTHEMGFARTVADRVGFLASGKIVELSPPRKLFELPESALCQRFLSKVMRY